MGFDETVLKKWETIVCYRTICAYRRVKFAVQSSTVMAQIDRRFSRIVLIRDGGREIRSEREREKLTCDGGLWRGEVETSESDEPC